jgi:hypothetical protein
MKYTTRETIRFGLTVCITLIVTLAVFLFVFDRLLDREHQRHSHLERASIIGAEVQVLRDRWLDDVRQLSMRRRRLQLLENPAIHLPEAADPAVRGQLAAASRRLVDRWERIVRRDEDSLKRLEAEHRAEVAKIR